MGFEPPELHILSATWIAAVTELFVASRTIVYDAVVINEAMMVGNARLQIVHIIELCLMILWWLLTIFFMHFGLKRQHRFTAILHLQLTLLIFLFFLINVVVTFTEGVEEIGSTINLILITILVMYLIYVEIRCVKFIKELTADNGYEQVA